MKARVKADYRWGVITAFAGCEYVKYEFRNVPPQFCDAAIAHDALDVMLDEDQEAIAAFAEAGGTVEEVEAKPVKQPKQKPVNATKRH